MRLEGTSSGGILSRFPTVKLARRRPQGVKKAVSNQRLKSTGPNAHVLHPQCGNCRNARKRCDEDRPCARCAKMGLVDCKDAPNKRGKSASGSRGAGVGAAFDQPQTAGAGDSMAMYQDGMYF